MYTPQQKLKGRIPTSPLSPPRPATLPFHLQFPLTTSLSFPVTAPSAVREKHSCRDNRPLGSITRLPGLVHFLAQHVQGHVAAQKAAHSSVVPSARVDLRPRPGAHAELRNLKRPSFSNRPCICCSFGWSCHLLWTKKIQHLRATLRVLILSWRCASQSQPGGRSCCHSGSAGTCHSYWTKKIQHGALRVLILSWRCASQTLEVELHQNLRLQLQRLHWAWTSALEQGHPAIPKLSTSSGSVRGTLLCNSQEARTPPASIAAAVTSALSRVLLSRPRGPGYHQKTLRHSDAVKTPCFGDPRRSELHQRRRWSCLSLRATEDPASPEDTAISKILSRHCTVRSQEAELQQQALRLL